MVWKVALEATAFKPAQFPPEGVPEVAVAGRSNVGKSTLINALLGAKLAHVGGTPGKTRSVNFYSVQSPAPFRLVDLPGYGYAKTGKEKRKIWSKFIEEYLLHSPRLKFVCQLIDIRQQFFFHFG